MDNLGSELFRRLGEEKCSEVGTGLKSGEGIGIELTLEAVADRGSLGERHRFVEGTVFKLGTNWLVIRTPSGYFHIMLQEIKKVFCVAIPPEELWGAHPSAKVHRFCGCREGCLTTIPAVS